MEAPFARSCDIFRSPDAGRRKVADGAGNGKEDRAMKVLARLVVVGLVVMTGIGTASDSESSRRSLKGLRGVAVLVEDLQADAERGQLDGWRTPVSIVCALLTTLPRKTSFSFVFMILPFTGLWFGL